MKHNSLIKQKGLVLLILLSFVILFSACKSEKKREKADDEELKAEKVEEKDDDKYVIVEKGDDPLALDIEEATIENENYRKVEWTGKYLQLVLMSLLPNEKIDLEIHNDHDQFIRIEKGEARVKMGKTKDNLTFDKTVSDDWSVLIPAGYWHQVINIGETDLKVYTLYAPPEHEPNLVQKKYEDAKGHKH